MTTTVVDQHGNTRAARRTGDHQRRAQRQRTDPLKRKLTKKAVDAIRPPKHGRSPVVVWDTELPGFSMRVTPKGVKTFQVRYRNAAGRQRMFKIGRYGALTPDQARADAVQVLARVERGEDPAADKRAIRDAPTVAAVCEIYLDEHVEPNRKPTTLRSYRSILKVWIDDGDVGSLRASEIRTEDVNRLFARIKRSKPYQANRVIAFLRAAFAYSIKYGLCDFNPCDGFDASRLHAETKRKRVLTKAEDERLIAALDSMESDPKERRAKTAFAAIRLIRGTGGRLREILNLKWQHVDFDRGCFDLPAGHPGTKSNRPRTIYFDDDARSLLESLPQTGEYVLPGISGDQARHDLKKPWRRVCERAELVGVRIHDLRRTFGSELLNSGEAFEVVQAALGHADVRTTQSSYAFIDEQRIAVAVRSRKRRRRLILVHEKKTA